MSSERRTLPEAGPPFTVGEHVRFGPTVFSTPDDVGWLKWEEAVITDVDYEAETFDFRFVSEPEGTRHAQGMEVIVRPTANYQAWRRAFIELREKVGEDEAWRETRDLWLWVLAEHPIHGRDAERVKRD